MNKRKTISLGLFMILLSTTPIDASKRVKENNSLAIQEVPFTSVHFTDSFWKPRMERNRKVTIPFAFNECERNGRIDNFAISGHLKEGKHQGDFSFDDTDPYKVIEGASYSLAMHYDKKLDHYLDSIIHIIATAQETDGYLTTCVTNRCTRLSGWWGTHRWEKINSHELYNSGHLIEAAIAHYRATGKQTLLNVAIKNADLVCKTFGNGATQIHRPSGHPIIEMALCKLYKLVGNKRYLDTAKYFIEETGRGTDGHSLNEYSQDHKPILQQKEIVGHAVRAGYLYSGVTEVASLTNDSAYLKALENLWNNMAGKKLYITGGIGSRAQGEGFGPNYELNNMTAYAETCASIANVYWNYRMFLASGDAKYVDVYERALYNGVISGVSLSGDKFFYDNPLESMGQHERQPWFGCACCPGNITRFMASIPQYQYAQQGKDIFVNLYIQGKAHLPQVTIEQTTNYPWDGHILMRLSPKHPQHFAIKLRIPSWLTQQPVASQLYSYTDQSPQYTIKINGETYIAPVQKGYVIITRTWKKNDKIELLFPMKARRIKANDNVEDDLNKLALERGPIVYCLEGKDQPDSNVFNKSIPSDVLITEKFIKDKLQGIVELQGKAYALTPNGHLNATTFYAIPYFAWNNRGNDAMAIWIPSSPASAQIPPQPSIASRATAFYNMNPIQKDAPNRETILSGTWGVNDQWQPKRSSDISKPYHYWWLKKGTAESIIYKLDTIQQISNVAVYWLDLDHYDGNFRVPESWKLYYKDNDQQWQEVKTTDQYGCLKDCYNSVGFEPITTNELKIVAQLQKNQSGGILEWKVNQ